MGFLVLSVSYNALIIQVAQRVKLGENVSLTNDEYKEYNSSLNVIAEMFPRNRKSASYKSDVLCCLFRKDPSRDRRMAGDGQRALRRGQQYP